MGNAPYVIVINLLGRPGSHEVKRVREAVEREFIGLDPRMTVERSYTVEELMRGFDDVTVIDERVDDA